MTKQPLEVSKKDIKYLLHLLDKSQGQAEAVLAENEGGGSDDKRAASLTRRQIIRIRLKLVDHYKK